MTKSILGYDLSCLRVYEQNICIYQSCPGFALKWRSSVFRVDLAIYTIYTNVETTNHKKLNLSWEEALSRKLDQSLNNFK